jgi:hypothetical protein
MRRDYVEPVDIEYEPTAHDDVLKRTQAHLVAAGAEAAAAVAKAEGSGAGQ